MKDLAHKVGISRGADARDVVQRERVSPLWTDLRQNAMEDKLLPDDENAEPQDLQELRAVLTGIPGFIEGDCEAEGRAGLVTDLLRQRLVFANASDCALDRLIGDPVDGVAQDDDVGRRDRRPSGIDCHEPRLEVIYEADPAGLNLLPVGGDVLRVGDRRQLETLLQLVHFTGSGR